ncbi:MAG TPA: amidohydrolase family protein [Candidatus Binataceae bacterium]|nr:amidohydrolase family protein [Candidatus Binataceae bacterium]
MNEGAQIEIDEPNRWRLKTPGHQGWAKTARPEDPNRYLMISADCHAQEPTGFWLARMDKKYHERLPRVVVDEKGGKWQIAEGMHKSRPLDINLQGEDEIRSKTGYTPEQRIADQRRDGVDAEIMFPNKGLTAWATRDAEFGAAQCAAWNDWAWETYGAYNDFISPIAAIMTADVNLAIAEIKRVTKLGFRGVNLPLKPIWASTDSRDPNYNMSLFDPMWAVIQDCDVAITFHIGTGRDPRAAGKEGGAIINYAAHALSPTLEPIACLCASGVLERFTKLRFAGIECGIGWVPWALEAMDEGARKHHMWSFPKLKKLPSEYFREHGATSFQDDPVGVELAEKYNLVDNFLWANDYPHHEGSWPHSAPSIERQMGGLKEASRAKILGGNAAKLFKFDVEGLLRRRNAAIN